LRTFDFASSSCCFFLIKSSRLSGVRFDGGGGGGALLESVGGGGGILGGGGGGGAVPFENDGVGGGGGGGGGYAAIVQDVNEADGRFIDLRLQTRVVPQNTVCDAEFRNISKRMICGMYYSLLNFHYQRIVEKSLIRVASTAERSIIILKLCTRSRSTACSIIISI
jgi:hypothetical protein